MSTYNSQMGLPKAKDLTQASSGKSKLEAWGAGGKKTVLDKDPNAIKRGIANLDKLMFHLQEKCRNSTAQVEADKAELAQIDGQMSKIRDSIDVLDKGLVEKMERRKQLDDEIRAKSTDLSTVLDQSLQLAKSVNRRNAQMYRKAASETLEFTRGFNTRDSVSLLRTSGPTTLRKAGAGAGSAAPVVASIGTVTGGNKGSTSQAGGRRVRPARTLGT